MGMHAHLQHPQPARPVVLPQWLVPLHVPVAPEDVVNQHIEAAALVIDGGYQGGILAGVFVINLPRGTPPAPPAARIRSPVSSVVPGLPISEGPAARLLRPVA